MMTLLKFCSLTRPLRRLFSSSSLKLNLTAVVFLLLSIFFTLPCSVFCFKSGHVEPVPGNNVLRRPLSQLPTSPAGSSGPGNNRNSNSFPPTGGGGSNGGSRSAILMKLTSPRREFGGHVYQDPTGPQQSPITSDLYAFSKSTESQQIQNDVGVKNHHHYQTPFIRFPTISSPFNGISNGGGGVLTSVQSRETQHLRHPVPQSKSIRNANSNAKEAEGHRHQKPFAHAVSDLLAQHEEPSSLFEPVRAVKAPSSLENEENEEDLLLDSYYTTGSEDFDNDRYGSQEEGALSGARGGGGDGRNDLFEKQTATPTPSTVSSVNASLASSSPSPPHHSSQTNNKSRSSTESNSSINIGNHSNQSSSSIEHHNLSKPTLLPLPANYLSLATFRQIDNTLEKSSSNILSRIANFWRNRTMMGGRNSHSINGTLTANNNNTNTNAYTKLGSDSSSSSNSAAVDNTETLTEHNDKDDDNHLDDINRTSDHDHRSHGNKINRSHNTNNNNQKKKEKQSESVGVQPSPKYVSIEDLDGVTFGGGGLSAANSNQYVSLDDDDDLGLGGLLGVDVGEDDFVAGSGGNTKEDEHTKGTFSLSSSSSSTTKKSSKQDEQDNNEILNDHLHRHHDHHSLSVEDYISSETPSSVPASVASVAASSSGIDDDWLIGGDIGGEDSAQSSHSFHNDLFHTTTGTITAVIKDNTSSNHGSSSKSKKDLMSSGSSKIERVQKSDSDKKGVISPTSVTSTGGGPSKRAESEKIWSSIDSHFGRNDLIESAESEEENDYYYGMTIGGFLKRELWTIPLFVLASLNMILIILFEVYVLCRARGTSRRHLFLGQMLLFGLFLCSFLALMFAVHPSIIGCFVGRLGVGITYSLIFSVLMVKCVFLLSLDTGVYLPTSYQGILLFFAVAVQVAIDTQWVIMYPPFLQTVESGRSILLQCGTSFVQLLYSLSYVGFLILVVGFLAGRAAYKGVVENYREAVYILITAVVTVPVALSWTVAGWMLQGRHQDACVSFGLVAHSLTTFLIMFMPKGRQLASLDKEAVCFEDQEDQCSGYSPSFFHFKPTTKNYKTALWGDGNLYTTLEPTVSTINPNVFFHRNDFHSGMIY